MTGGWAFSGQPAQVGSGTVNLVEGSSFCLSGPDGDVAPDAAQGLFLRDTRVLSDWRLPVEGCRTRFR
ncbi:glycogen debranching N-terminal domain-containing protein [Streptomyces sp. NPDC005917]|uniref:glycogen debranching N-terminal domain-containing protein n=1 Tax=unclassified Streptomyces TaxID=2593676 RepID=UPI0033C18C2F